MHQPVPTNQLSLLSVVTSQQLAPHLGLRVVIQKELVKQILVV